MIGPGPAPAKQRQKRPLQFEQAFLDALPSAVMCVFFFKLPPHLLGSGFARQWFLM
jgi:hypothetical protein